MSLEPGTRLGPYEIVRPLGKGGMGEVYEARDPRLQRAVAVKVLPAHVRADATLLSRFQREARALSSLSHPHVCAVYDVGSEGDVDFLVMERLGAKVQVSTDGGYSPVWSRDGRELFYARARPDAYTGDLWAVAVGPGEPPRLGTPRRLFDLEERRLWLSSLVSGFGVARDGRFYFPQTLESPSSAEPRQLHLVQGWASELRRRAPEGPAAPATPQ